MLNDSNAQQGLKNIDQQAERTGTRLSGVSQLGGFMGKAIAAGAALAASGLTVLSGIIGRTGIAYNAMMEQSQVAWTTLLGSQGQAKKMLEDIANFAKATPFETEQVDLMAKYMHNAGLSGKELFDSLMKVSDVSSAFNIPAAEAQELTRQMSQVRQAGVAYTEDLNVLQDRGIPIYKAISEQLGVTVADVRKMASEGKISSDIYIKAFDGIAKGVEGASEKQSKTLSGLWSTLKDNLSQISGELTKGVFAKLKSILEEVMPTIERFSNTLKKDGLQAAIIELLPQSVIDKLISFGETIVNLKNQFSPLFETIKSSTQSLVDSVGPIWESLKKLFDSLLPILKPLGEFLAVTFVVQWGIVISVFSAVVKAIGPIINAFINFVDVVVNVVMTIVSLLTGDFDGAMKYWNKATQSSIDFFKNIWEGIKNFFKGLLDTMIGYVKSWGVYDEISKIFNNAKDAIINPIQKAVSFVSDAIDDIKGYFNGLSLKLPDIKTPSFKLKNWSINPMDWIKKMPYIDVEWNALGDNFFKGGLSVVGERGPELVQLPRGSKIKTANETRNMLGGQGNIYQVTVNKEDTAYELVRELQRMEVLYG